MHANQLFSMVFSLTLTEKVPSSLNERRRLTRIIKNDNSVFNFLIKMKCQHVIPSAQETGKERGEFSLGQRVKTMVTVD